MQKYTRVTVLLLPPSSLSLSLSLSLDAAELTEVVCDLRLQSFGVVIVSIRTEALVLRHKIIKDEPELAGSLH